MKLSIVIPVFNEENTIDELVERVEAVDLAPLGVEKELVIVDDGSSDRTDDHITALDAKYHNIKLVCHETNRGKGTAIRTGLEHVSGDVTLIQDADLEYHPDDYPALLRPFLEQNADVVYGSRFLAKVWPENMMRAHWWGNKVLTGLANLLYGVRITDEATCYKVFRTDVLKSFALKCKQFEFCCEVTAKTGKGGYEIVEVPILYRARSVAEGKKIAWRDGVQAVWALLKYRFRN